MRFISANAPPALVGLTTALGYSASEIGRPCRSLSAAATKNTLCASSCGSTYSIRPISAEELAPCAPVLGSEGLPGSQR